MNNGEIWRIVPSVPSLIVSSEGRIMSTPKLGEMPHGGSRHYGGEPTWGVWSKQSARFIIVRGSTTYKIHRLIAEAFHGAAPFNGAVVMHIDENSANNRAGNLRWGTQKENLNAPGFIKYCRSRVGADSPSAKARKKSEAA